MGGRAGARALAEGTPSPVDYDARRHRLVREGGHAPIDTDGPLAERVTRTMTELEEETELADRERGLWPGRSVPHPVPL